MKSRASWQISLGILAVGAITMLSYQNCSVRRLSGVGTSSSSSSLSGSGGSTGTSTGTGTGTTTTTDKNSCSADNMIQSVLQGTFTGTESAGLPVIQSSYAFVYGTSDTQLMIIANSDCVSKNTYTNTTGACAAFKYPSLGLRIDAYCDNDNAGVTDCTRFSSKLNQAIPLNDATLGAKIQISANRMSANYVSNSYAQAYPVSTRKGSIKFTALPMLANGNIVTVELTNAEILDNDNNAKTLVINGTFSGQIVTKTCSPGL